MQIDDILDLGDFILLFVAIGLCLYRGLWRIYYVRIILIYLLSMLLTYGLALCLVKVQHVKNNLFLFHIFKPLEYTLISVLYCHILKQVLIRRFIAWSVPVYLFIAVFLSVFVQKITEDNAYATVIASLLIIIWALLYFREIMLSMEVHTLHRFALFWINVGILFHFIGSLVIEGLFDYLIKHNMPLAMVFSRMEFIFDYILLFAFITGIYDQIRYEQ